MHADPDGEVPMFHSVGDRRMCGGSAGDNRTGEAQTETRKYRHPVTVKPVTPRLPYSVAMKNRSKRSPSAEM